MPIYIYKKQQFLNTIFYPIIQTGFHGSSSTFVELTSVNGSIEQSSAHFYRMLMYQSFNLLQHHIPRRLKSGICSSGREMSKPKESDSDDDARSVKERARGSC
ncbi:hypothetical protein L596_020863 [Steinernema carpocapsae]|uniref:Uncharacterized protein n=1 Tax=Steinernema carpocapsae TaxID=34508 RepID=A0A4V6XW06_STECR|nr:hypothetical protein L596_020784 [Steinernema carpocapsae]TKR73565.1 hypothetical protein L596_020863 [Steinernema carpocapsae]